MRVRHKKLKRIFVSFALEPDKPASGSAHMIQKELPRSGARAVYFGGPGDYQGGSKLEIKHKSRCLQKRKLVNWGGQACRLEGPSPPDPHLAPALELPLKIVSQGIKILYK